MAQKSRTQQLNGLTSLSYMGVLPSSPTNFIIEQHAPTSSDYRNVYVGDIWLDNSSMYNIPPTAPTGFNLWILVDVAGHFATWINFGSGMVASVGAGHDIFITGSPTAPIVNVTNAITLGDLSVIPVNTDTLTLVTGDATIQGGNLNMTNTNNTGTAGIIAFGGTGYASRFISNYGTNNTFIGSLSGNDTITVGSATGSTCIGYLTGNALITARNSTFVGQQAGYQTTDGIDCTAIGSLSLSSFTSGASGAGANTACGALSLANLVSGVQNCVFGDSAALNLVSGSYNVIAGGTGTASNYVGSESNNVVLGTGQSCVAGELGIVRLGGVTGMSNNNNTFVGYSAGNSTYTLASSVYNTFIGSGAGISISTGQRNFCGGGASGSALSSGQFNTFLGMACADTTISGSGNTVIGYDTVGSVSGINNLILGQSSGAAYVGSESNNILLANGGVVGESQILRVGNSTSPLLKAFIGGIRGVTTDAADAIAVLISSTGQLGTVSSSARYKDEIEDMGSDSDFLYNLRPVSFRYKDQSSRFKSVGLIAEEVDKVSARLVVYDEDGRPETVKYHDLVPMLLNEIQKLNKRVLHLEGK